MGAPPEVAARLAAAQQEFEARQRAAFSTSRDPSKDPELDQFMVKLFTYCLINLYFFLIQFMTTVYSYSYVWMSSRLLGKIL